MQTKADIYQIYCKEIVPLMAEMHAYAEADYREHNEDVADLFQIIVRHDAASGLSDEDRTRAEWFITKIKIAAYHYIVREIKVKLDEFDKRSTVKNRVHLEIEQEYEELKGTITAHLKTIERRFGKHPKICEECLVLYEETYQACIRVFSLMESVSAKVSWIYPYSAFSFFKRPVAWIFSLVVSILTELLMFRFNPEWIDQVKNWLF